MGKKKLDLYRSYRRRTRQGAEDGWLRAFYLPAVLILAVGLGAWGVLKLESHALRDRIAAAEQQLASDEELYHEAEVKWAFNEALMERIALTETLTQRLATYPDITADLSASITAVGGENVTMTLMGWDDAEGALEFRAHSTEVLDIPACISALRGTGLFSTVTYDGYRYDRGAYHLELRCILREGGAA